MRKLSTLQCTLVRFLVPMLIVVSFCYANSAVATTEVSGNEVNTNGKLLENQELVNKSPEVHDEEAKFKGFFPPKPIFKKPIPIIKPKPIPIPVYKPVPKPIPIVKPIPKPIIVKKPVPVPEYKPIPKPIPIVKPIPKPIIKKEPTPIPVFKKPIDKPIPLVKPFPKPFPVPEKPFFPPDTPVAEPESFMKPKPFFKKPTPKLPLHPEFKKPLPPPLPIDKPIPSP